MTYNERLQSIAEEMALHKMVSHWEKTGRIYTIENWQKDPQKNFAITKMIPTAHIAIWHMANLVEPLYHAEAMREGWGHDQIDGVVQERLKENGLIPNQEAATQC